MIYFSIRVFWQVTFHRTSGSELCIFFQSGDKKGRNSIESAWVAGYYVYVIGLSGNRAPLLIWFYVILIFFFYYLVQRKIKEEREKTERGAC